MPLRRNPTASADETARPGQPEFLGIEWEMGGMAGGVGIESAAHVLRAANHFPSRAAVRERSLDQADAWAQEKSVRFERHIFFAA